MARDFRDCRRQLTVFRQRVKHTPTAIHSAVTAGERRRQHDKVDNACRGGDADFREGEHKGAAVAANLIPRENGDDHENRANIKNQDTPQHFTHRATQRHLRILRFTGGNTDQLNPLIRGHHDTQCGQKAFPAAGKKAAMLGQITKANRLAAVTKAEENHPQTDDDHHNNRGDFDHRKPELDFTIQAHRSQIRQRDQSDGNQRRYPLCHLRKPELDVDPNGGNFRDPDRHPHKPV